MELAEWIFINSWSIVAIGWQLGSAVQHDRGIHDSPDQWGVVGIGHLKKIVYCEFGCGAWIEDIFVPYQ